MVKKLKKLSKTDLIQLLISYSTDDSNPNKEELHNELNRIQSKRRAKYIFRTTIEGLIVAIAIAILVSQSILPIFKLHSDSMYPTLQSGDTVAIVKSEDIERGDVVAFYVGNKLLIKRCIAGPGDVLNISKDGEVYVNGEMLDEPYVDELSLGDCDVSLPVTVPNNRWFVLGDNRDTSIDSRNKVIGYVTSEQILGKVEFVLFPFNRMSAVD